MEDKGRKAQVKEGSSVLKRPRDEEEEEDLPNSAAASSATASASGTKTEVKAKRLSLDPPKPVTAGSYDGGGPLTPVWKQAGHGCLLSSFHTMTLNQRWTRKRKKRSTNHIACITWSEVT
ncbi:uncharacterized protein LOC110886058 isoform X2 [Helianthus annuus]|uniref:uncharacterized protein LOC110886058 isoform X2 n=1 Tax=Helianthus annuus TaxID=4232 RepID=UPI0016533125|nr:uncharacterized protein LOC110886058 isoform X2 [Helianthus annuus]